MGSALNDAPGLHHRNLMRVHHGREPVRDDQCGLVLRDAFTGYRAALDTKRVQRFAIYLLQTGRWLWLIPGTRATAVGC